MQSLLENQPKSDLASVYGPDHGGQVIEQQQGYGKGGPSLSVM